MQYHGRPGWRIAETRADVNEKADKELILEDFLPYRLAILSHTVSTSIARAYDQRFGLTIAAGDRNQLKGLSERRMLTYAFICQA